MRRTGIEPPRTENIRSLVAEGNEILVQVVKDPLGTKGARLTTYITLPSRHLVYMRRGRGVGGLGANRGRKGAQSPAYRGPKRSDARGERRLHRAHGRGGCPVGGFAQRHDYLRKLWEFVRQKGLRTQPGNLVHADLPLHLRVLRDLLGPDVDRVLIDQPSAHREMQEFAATFMPEALPRIELYGEARPVFELHHVEEEIRRHWTARSH